jgi:hypothetical protein
MRLFHKREVPPPEVLARLPRDERVVSWADVVGGAVVIASPGGLWWPTATPEPPRLIAWQYITKAVWHARALSVTEADVVADLLLVDRAPVAVELEVPRDLPPVVRKRVEANVVRSELIEFAGGTARFVARRIPGEDGVRWWARLEGGTPDTDQVRSAVSARMAVLRAEHAARS